MQRVCGFYLFDRYTNKWSLNDSSKGHDHDGHGKYPEHVLRVVRVFPHPTWKHTGYTFLFLKYQRQLKTPS